MKTNIKMIVTLEQSIKVQEICFENGIIWTHKAKQLTNLHLPYLYICKIEGIYATSDIECYDSHLEYQEIDADLFIRTNGTCEEISDEGLSKIKAASEGKSTEYLQEKIINLHKQINKDRATINNQREELNKLNLKLQKCISLEEHNKKMESIEFDLNMFKSSNKLRGDLIEKLESENIEMTERIEKINKDNANYLSDNILSRDKQIEKLKAVIEYLESKVK